MRQKQILGSFVFVCGVWSLGCQPPELGVEGWVEAQRASAESVCGCASALGSSVSDCLDDLDAARLEDARGAYDCLYEGLAVDPDAEATFDCEAASLWTLDACASESSCGEDRLERCLDEHAVRLSRCPGISTMFAEVSNLCFDRLAIAREPARRLYEALGRMRYPAGTYDVSTGISHRIAPAWRDCVLPYLELYEAQIRDHAVCAVPHYDAYNECVEDSNRDACAPLLEPVAACTPLDPALQTLVDTCDARIGTALTRR